MSIPRVDIGCNSLETTDGSTNKVYSYQCDVDGIYFILVDVMAFNETDGTAYYQRTQRGFKRVSGTVTALAAQANVFANGDATITVTISNSGDEIKVDVAGVAAKTIDWNITTSLKLT